MTIGPNLITLIDPPPLPDFMASPTTFFESFRVTLQSIAPVSSTEASAVRMAGQSVLKAMGAGPTEIALAFNGGQPLEPLCRLFCSKDAPIRIGESVDGTVAFRLHEPARVKAEELGQVAQVLEQCGMAVQAAALLTR